MWRCPKSKSGYPYINHPWYVRIFHVDHPAIGAAPHGPAKTPPWPGTSGKNSSAKPLISRAFSATWPELMESGASRLGCKKMKIQSR